jgi:2-dehydro-3-deoxygalactonokinase
MNGFLSCDWGTTSFRLRFVSLPEFKVVADVNSGEGIAATFNLWKAAKKKEEERLPFYLSVLKEKIKGLEEKIKISLNNVPVIISGMASSSIGMKEMLYKPLPVLLNGSDLIAEKILPTSDFNHILFIISGIRTENDVIRGEETQLVGSVSSFDKEQIFIFPGTHSKHVFVKAGRAISFKTYMTGEFFELLANKSILVSSIAKSGVTDGSIEAFTKGVKAAQSNLLHASFMIRTNQLFNKYSKEENYYYLSGLLIGSELYDLKLADEKILLIGTEELSFYYAKALEVIYPGRDIAFFNAEEATIKGQHKIYAYVMS